jgi:hypothetical protein
MTNERQAEANRQNAQKSTGPRTPAGKAAVALNGIKHGLLSRECLLKGESEAELVDFGKRLRAKLAPVGELELLFADRVISTAWRLRRLVAVETMHFNREHSVDYGFNNCGREKMGVLSRYEMTLERSLYKALHELQRRKPRATDKPSRFQRRWTWISPSRRRTRGIKWLCLAKASALQARESKNQSAIKSHVKPINWEIEWRNRRFCWP